MNLRRLAIVTFACATIGLAAYVHNANATNQKGVTPSRLIEYFPIGTVIDLNRLPGENRVKILDKEEIELWHTQATDLIESHKALNVPDGNSKLRIQVESKLYSLSSPWKVIGLGENYVKLEPILQLPLHSKCSWIILPESSFVITGE